MQVIVLQPLWSTPEQRGGIPTVPLIQLVSSVSDFYKCQINDELIVPQPLK